MSQITLDSASLRQRCQVIYSNISSFLFDTAGFFSFFFFGGGGGGGGFDKFRFVLSFFLSKSGL